MTKEEKYSDNSINLLVTYSHIYSAQSFDDDDDVSQTSQLTIFYLQ